MCAHYEAAEHNLLEGLTPGDTPLLPPTYAPDIWPGKLGPVLIGGGAPSWQLASFGLMPNWAKPTHYRHTYNARTETLGEKPSFRDAWRKRQLCAVPVAAIYEPNYSTGRAQSHRITQQDKTVFWLAGLWECFTDVFGQAIWSHSLITINADNHPFMRQFHGPDDEKRSVVVLQNEQVLPWLNARSANEANDFFKPMAADAFASVAQ